MNVERVGIVGCGTMGAGIAQVCAERGLSVLVAVSTQDSGGRGRARIVAALDRAVRKDQITEAQRETWLRRVSFTTTLADLADRQVVIEAITEDEDEKSRVFRLLGRVADDEAVLASNTSSIPISRLARVTCRPEAVIGIHFFNPVPVLPLVELVSSLDTGDVTKKTAELFAAESLGKEVVWSPDRAGFTVNALLIPYLLAAVRMVESGFSSAESVDRAMTLGCHHPLGPLALADLIGLDVVAAIATAMYEEHKEPLYAPPPSLLRMVESGSLGRKTGRGFHAYATTGP